MNCFMKKNCFSLKLLVGTPLLPQQTRRHWIFVITLGHWQASVERGCSIDSSMLIKNMKGLSLVSRCNIPDFMASNNLKAHALEIGMEMIKAI